MTHTSLCDAADELIQSKKLDSPTFITCIQYSVCESIWIQETDLPRLQHLSPAALYMNYESVWMWDVHTDQLVHKIRVVHCECPCNSATPVMSYQYTGAVA